MKIDNPPSPPFRKGGMGGFESYFLRNKKFDGMNGLKKIGILIIGFFLFILFFGFSIAVPLFVFLYIKLYGKEKWVISVTMAVMSWFFFYGLFVWLLDTPFEEGLVLKVLKAIVIG